jgi:hypothetical protein
VEGLVRHERAPARAAKRRALLGHPHQAFGAWIGQRPQQDRVDDAEDGGVGADAEGQRRDGDGREGAMLAEQTETMPDVLPEVSITIP